MKVLEQEEEKVSTETIKFSDTTVRDESSIQISSQIQKQLKELPKPSVEAEPANQEADLLPADENVSPEPTDFQLPEDVENFDIDESFIKMIEDELGGKSLDDDIESGNIGKTTALVLTSVQKIWFLYISIKKLY